MSGSSLQTYILNLAPLNSNGADARRTTVELKSAQLAELDD